MKLSRNNTLLNKLLLCFLIASIETEIGLLKNVKADIEFTDLDFEDLNNIEFNATNKLLAEIKTDYENIEQNSNKKTDDSDTNSNFDTFLPENITENNNAEEKKDDLDLIRIIESEEQLNLGNKTPKEIKNLNRDVNVNNSDINTDENEIRPEELRIPSLINKIPKDTKELKSNENVTQPDTKNNEISEDDDCIGQIEYCNMTQEEYFTMLDNYIYPQPYEWVLIATHSIVFIVGLIGNALVCTAVYRNYSMRTVTNYFIVNLAVADFMVILICLPPTVLWDVTETWFLGEGLCKVMLYFQSVSVTVSVLTLTFISVDRWYAICFPLKFKSTTGRAKTAILIIWIVSLIFNSPELVVLTTVRTVPLRFNLTYLVQCMATWSERSDLVWHIVKVLFIYTLPLILMTIAYCQIVRVLWSSQRIPGRADDAEWSSAEQSQLRSRRKAAKMLVAVVVMFAVCYFPVHLLSVLRYALEMEQSDVITCLALISHVLCYANSAINPVIYNFMSGKFRNEFRRTFCCIPRPLPDQFTTLTRVSSKHYNNRKSYDMTLHDSRGHANCKHVTTSFIANGKIDRVGFSKSNGRNNHSFKN